MYEYWMQRLQKSNLGKLSSLVYAGAITVCAQNFKFLRAEYWFDQMLKNGFEPTMSGAVLWAAMISECKDATEAWLQKLILFGNSEDVAYLNKMTRPKPVEYILPNATLVRTVKSYLKMKDVFQKYIYEQPMMDYAGTPCAIQTEIKEYFQYLDRIGRTDSLNYDIVRTPEFLVNFVSEGFRKSIDPVENLRIPGEIQIDKDVSKLVSNDTKVPSFRTGYATYGYGTHSQEFHTNDPSYKWAAIDFPESISTFDINAEQRRDKLKFLSLSLMMGQYLDDGPPASKASIANRFDYGKPLEGPLIAEADGAFKRVHTLNAVRVYTKTGDHPFNITVKTFTHDGSHDVVLSGQVPALGETTHTFYLSSPVLTTHLSITLSKERGNGLLLPDCRLGALVRLSSCRDLEKYQRVETSKICESWPVIGSRVILKDLPYNASALNGALGVVLQVNRSQALVQLSHAKQKISVSKLFPFMSPKPKCLSQWKANPLGSFVNYDDLRTIYRISSVLDNSVKVFDPLPDKFYAICQYSNVSLKSLYAIKEANITSSEVICLDRELWISQGLDLDDYKVITDIAQKMYRWDGMPVEEGHMLQCFAPTGHWEDVTVTSVESSSVRIRYAELNDPSLDEWVHFSSPRLRPPAWYQDGPTLS
eukprot:CAMPEP_0167743210 /NCGR_PEP_ID=MMETSP0110_2-20121227/1886_1 /TAXON_ID=629695 /ORGANISM="Gymnochlora sp., Strain CCMP2014" /LENGTH=646 /DNA_ID=CAMNT_0007627549 /DNA_START=177 /DNA_END=2117 /DNA_ORIENTATION=+